ncbi:hypothetical protein BJF78_01465 [Pseudonocardia sp. CNS-139]|nr:hypothetical protein BJF78_01465 [Pseudonocardia sp. CNS-139]
MATVVVPVVYGVVRDDLGQVLLVRRVDSGDWEPPGGRVDPGESAAAALVREVAEESGFLVEATGVSGLYTDPRHVVLAATGEVRQPFAVCFHATVRGGTARPDGVETCDVRWWPPAQLAGLPMQPAARLRLDHALTSPDVVFSG